MKKFVSVIGGITIDIKGLPMPNLLPGTSNPGKVYISSGGVGRNIAHNLALLSVPVYLFGAVGDDVFGTRIINETKQAGVNVDYIRVLHDQCTGVYLSILNTSHELSVAISDMEITHFVDKEYLHEHQEVIQNSRMVVLDTNLAPDVLVYIIELCKRAHIPCLIDPVSAEKAKKLHTINGELDYITPNRVELEALCHRDIDHLSQLEEACTQVSSKYQHLLVTLGEDGVYYYSRKHHIGKRYPPFKTQIVDPNGAGDAFVAGLVCGVFRDFEIDYSIQLGMAAAHLTLQSKNTVNKEITFEQCSAWLS